MSPNARKKPPTKAEKRLAARRKDFKSVDTTKRPGYHEPGSLKK